jgi:hypothetical protein
METRRDVIVRAAVLADELGYEVFALPWHNIEATLRAAAPGARPQMRPSDLTTTAAGQAAPGHPDNAISW